MGADILNCVHRLERYFALPIPPGAASLPFRRTLKTKTFRNFFLVCFQDALEKNTGLMDLSEEFVRIFSAQSEATTWCLPFVNTNIQRLTWNIGQGRISARGPGADN